MKMKGILFCILVIVTGSIVRSQNTKTQYKSHGNFFNGRIGRSQEKSKISHSLRKNIAEPSKALSLNSGLEQTDISNLLLPKSSLKPPKLENTKNAAGSPNNKDRKLWATFFKVILQDPKEKSINPVNVLRSLIAKKESNIKSNQDQYNGINHSQHAVPRKVQQNAIHANSLNSINKDVYLKSGNHLSQTGQDKKKAQLQKNEPTPNGQSSSNGLLSILKNFPADLLSSIVKLAHYFQDKGITNLSTFNNLNGLHKLSKKESEAIQLAKLKLENARLKSELQRNHMNHMNHINPIQISDISAKQRFIHKVKRPDLSINGKQQNAQNAIDQLSPVVFLSKTKQGVKKQTLKEKSNAVSQKVTDIKNRLNFLQKAPMKPGQPVSRVNFAPPPKGKILIKLKPGTQMNLHEFLHKKFPIKRSQVKEIYKSRNFPIILQMLKSSKVPLHPNMPKDTTFSTKTQFIPQPTQSSKNNPKPRYITKKSVQANVVSHSPIIEIIHNKQDTKQSKINISSAKTIQHNNVKTHTKQLNEMTSDTHDIGKQVSKSSEISLDELNNKFQKDTNIVLRGDIPSASVGQQNVHIHQIETSTTGSTTLKPASTFSEMSTVKSSGDKHIHMHNQNDQMSVDNLPNANDMGETHIIKPTTEIQIKIETNNIMSNSKLVKVESAKKEKIKINTSSTTETTTSLSSDASKGSVVEHSFQISSTEPKQNEAKQYLQIKTYVKDKPSVDVPKATSKVPVVENITPGSQNVQESTSKTPLSNKTTTTTKPNDTSSVLATTTVGSLTLKRDISITTSKQRNENIIEQLNDTFPDISIKVDFKSVNITENNQENVTDTPIAIAPLKILNNKKLSEHQLSNKHVSTNGNSKYADIKISKNESLEPPVSNIRTIDTLTLLTNPGNKSGQDFNNMASMIHSLINTALKMPKGSTPELVIKSVINGYSNQPLPLEKSTNDANRVKNASDAMSSEVNSEMAKLGNSAGSVINENSKKPLSIPRPPPTPSKPPPPPLPVTANVHSEQTVINDVIHNNANILTSNVEPIGIIVGGTNLQSNWNEYGGINVPHLSGGIPRSPISSSTFQLPPSSYGFGAHEYNNGNMHNNIVHSETGIKNTNMQQHTNQNSVNANAEGYATTTVHPGTVDRLISLLRGWRGIDAPVITTQSTTTQSLNFLNQNMTFVQPTMAPFVSNRLRAMYGKNCWNNVCGSDGITYISECVLTGNVTKACDGYCPCPQVQHQQQPLQQPTLRALILARLRQRLANQQAQYLPTTPDSLYFGLGAQTTSVPPRAAPAVAAAAAAGGGAAAASGRLNAQQLARCIRKCPNIVEPVCSARGITHNNHCILTCSRQKMMCLGPCPCEYEDILPAMRIHMVNVDEILPAGGAQAGVTRPTATGAPVNQNMGVTVPV